MHTLTIHTDPAYPVYIGSGLIQNTGSLIEHLGDFERVCVVTDDNVEKLYLETVLNSFGEQVQTASFVIPHGEQSKSLSCLGQLYDFFAAQKMTRSDLIIALGGGVVGDLTGFAASSFLRGVKYVQIPTTLLAQVDSSVGGKTAIDIPAGKNLVGSFYQPSAVICDLNTLSTLSDTIFSDGCAEIIKYACIYDASLFDLIYRIHDRDTLEKIITRCLEIKAEVVAKDEKDTGLRMILNFGHTLGHAVEKKYHFSTYTHGQGVAIGMVKITKLSEKAGLTSPGTADKISDLCQKMKLPVDCEISQDELFDICCLDKKNLHHKIHLILLKEIGSCFIHKLSQNEFKTFLNQ